MNLKRCIRLQKKYAEKTHEEMINDIGNKEYVDYIKSMKKFTQQGKMNKDMLVVEDLSDRDFDFSRRTMKELL